MEKPALVRSEIAILGAGSWGTALAVHLACLDRHVRLWTIEGDVVADMTARRANAAYLPDVTLPPLVEPTASLADALRGASIVVAAVPTQAMRPVVRQAASVLAPDAIVVSAAKGLELDTHRRMSEVVAEETGGRHAVVALSGPSFAIEVAQQLPTAVSAASDRLDAAERVQAEFRGRSFRVYTTPDVVGVEIGGAMKNIIAIAAGVADGLGLGHNALAALITRGLVEISRLAVAEGARRETLAGLTGLGDLVLTCTGPYSRNRHVGIELARGRSLPEILASMKHVAEGVRTTDAALAMGAARGLELPITAQMADVLAGRKTPRAAIEDLMLRPPRVEADAG
jgi:glycerol-3-phosphate dehydrogenase (NAD(P)+)